MKIIEDKKNKLVEIWLTNGEKADMIIQKNLKSIYIKYKSKNFLVAVFEGGKGNLFESTRDLLSYNRNKSKSIS